MARTRSIKPGFFTNERMAELDPLTRIMFIGLWTIADHRGCIEWRPKRIKIQTMPYDNLDMEAAADGLQTAGFLHRYEVGGQQYIKIINFEKHQNPHKQERDTIPTIPDYPMSQLIKNEIVDAVPNNIGSTSEVNVPSSSYLLPSSDYLNEPPLLEIFVGTLNAEIAKRMGIKKLPASHDWNKVFLWAFNEGFTVDQVLQCYDLTKKDPFWKDKAIPPKTLAANLPNVRKSPNDPDRLRSADEMKKDRDEGRQHIRKATESII
jgi:hypothetical protein